MFKENTKNEDKIETLFQKQKHLEDEVVCLDERKDKLKSDLNKVSSEKRCISDKLDNLKLNQLMYLHAINLNSHCTVKKT